MEIKYKFKLPEEQDKYRIHNKAIDMYLFIMDLQTYLRDRYKYDETLIDKEPVKLMEEIRETFYQYLNERNINLDIMG